jgi:hypothetical protein
VPAPGCHVQLARKMVLEVQGGMLAPPCMDHRMCSWPGRWYQITHTEGYPPRGKLILSNNAGLLRLMATQVRFQNVG